MCSFRGVEACVHFERHVFISRCGGMCSFRGVEACVHFKARPTREGRDCLNSSRVSCDIK